MTSVVMRVVIDPHGELSPDSYAAGLHQLRACGLEIIATDPKRLAPARREIELVLEEAELREGTAEILTECRAAFGIDPEPGVVTFISRGTDDDARGVLRRFGVDGDVRRGWSDGEEIVEIVLRDVRAVPEGRLRTAMEAALNLEVRILVEQ